MTITHTTASQEGNDAFAGNNTHAGTETFNGPLVVNGAATMANVTLGTANTLAVNNIKQQAGAPFALLDPLGVSHVFISNSSPYTNTFLNGNGSGGVFLGSAALCSVADTTGNLTTAGNISSTQTGGGSSAGITGKATAPFVAWQATGQAADQKWWDLGANGLTLTGRAVNDANSGSATWLTVNRGAGATIGAVTFGAGGGVQTLPTATDTLVGKATTDTLSNKTLTGALSGNNVTLINWQGSAGAITGNGADQNIYSFSIPGNTMGAGKGIYITAAWQHTTGAAAVTTKFKYGATTVATNSENGTGLTIVTWYVMNNPGVTNAQTAWQEIGQDAGSAVIYSPQIASPAENTTGAVTAAVTFNVAGTDAVTPKFFKIELVQ